MLRLIGAANAARLWTEGVPQAPSSRAAEAEGWLEGLFGVGGRLAVYGTLVPGGRNHHVVAPLGGEWTEGVVEGDRHDKGWGTALGAPAFRPRAGGPIVEVHLLNSPALPAAWPELDRFEGEDYMRILVPVFLAAPPDERTFRTVANIYAAAPGTPRGA